MKFNEFVAKSVLTQMREGKTLTTICEGFSGLQRTDVYDWLRSGDAKIGDEQFKSLYFDAEEDRRRTWRDMAAHQISQLSNDDVDVAVVKAQAQMLMALAKEPSVKDLERQIGKDVPVVVIRKFMPTLEEEL